MLLNVRQFFFSRRSRDTRCRRDWSSDVCSSDLILKNAGFSTILAGNIGTRLISYVEKTSDKTITVAELSSFQLELIEKLRPNISVFLNLTPDHLDRHHTLESYGAAKARIFENQTEADSAVLNADDPVATPYAPAKPQVFWFSRKQRVAEGAFVKERSEEHTSELQSRLHLVCRLLLETT